MGIDTINLLSIKDYLSRLQIRIQFSYEVRQIIKWIAYFSSQYLLDEQRLAMCKIIRSDERN
jgi:hypothetical protein